MNDVVLNIDADLKVIHKAVAASERAAVGYRETLQNMLCLIYSTGIKYKNTPDIIDKKLEEIGLSQKRGKEASFYNKILKLAFAQKTDEGYEIAKEDVSRISKFGKVLEIAETQGVNESNAKEFFREGLQKRLQGQRETVVETPDEQIENDAEKILAVVREHYTGDHLTEVLRRVIADLRPVSGDEKSKFYGLMVLSQFLTPIIGNRGYAVISCDGKDLTVESVNNDPDAAIYGKLPCEIALGRCVLDSREIKRLKSMIRKFGDLDWREDKSDYGSYITIDCNALSKGEWEERLIKFNEKGLRIIHAMKKIGIPLLDADNMDVVTADDTIVFDLPAPDLGEDPVLECFKKIGVKPEMAASKEDLIRLTGGGWTVIVSS